MGFLALPADKGLWTPFLRKKRQHLAQKSFREILQNPHNPIDPANRQGNISLVGNTPINAL